MAASWNETYRLHFQNYFGKPFDIQSYDDTNGCVLSLATHDWARQGFHVYASTGLADRLVRDGVEDFGEVILFSDARDAQIPKLFINAIFFILREKIPLGSRFAIAFGGPDHVFAERYGKTALYFTRPAMDDDEEKFNVLRRGEEFGRVYQAYFISPEEDEFLDEHGADAFEHELRTQFDHLKSEEALGPTPEDPGPPPEEPAEMKEYGAKIAEYQAKLAKFKEQEWRFRNKAMSVRRQSCV